jgi:hypothetical protein
MEIKSALDWQQVSETLRAEIRYIGFNPDLVKMLGNITIMVTDLSKLEVNSRRLHAQKILTEPLAKINQSIKHLEQLLLVARLMK